MYSNPCVEHPLGILCKCTDYQEVVNKFTPYNIGTHHYLLSKISTEPTASAKVIWVENHISLRGDISKPILIYPQENPNITACNVNQMWIPTVPDLIPLKYIIKL